MSLLSSAARIVSCFVVAVAVARGQSLEELAAMPERWPAEVTVTTAARATLVDAQGAAGGAMLLGAGHQLAVLAISPAGITGKAGRSTVLVAADKTDLWQRVAGASASPTVRAPTVSAAPARSAAPSVPAPATAKPRVPATRLETLLQGKLVRFADGRVQSFDPARLNGVKFYGIYFSASWCGPCREFTPELIKDYAAIRAVYPEFEIIFVSWDRLEADMHGYLRDDQMPWPALRFADRRLPELAKLAGPGIPCLVLVDGDGKELSHSYRWGRYVGPQRVVEDTWKILKEARRQRGVMQ